MAQQRIPLSVGRLLTACGLVVNNTLGRDASERLTLEKKRICFPKVSESGTFMVQKNQNFKSRCVSLYPSPWRSVVKINDTDKEAKPLVLRPKQA